MTLRRVGLSNSLSSQAKISNKRFTLSRVSLRRFPFPTVSGPTTISNYVEDVFSTYVYTGNGSSQNIENGIDLSTKGGLVWTKTRNATEWHILGDTVTGSSLYSNSTTTAGVLYYGANQNGYGLGGNSQSNLNNNTHVSWTFRKQQKFFDIVTYTGNGQNSTPISHNLGSIPGCIIIKCRSNATDWIVWHRSMPESYYLRLNSNAAAGISTRVNNVTSTSFNLSNDADVNGDTRTYVAYVFAHNAGGFGDSGSDNVISCGSYDGNGNATGPEVNLGFEPQWILVKRLFAGTNAWYIIDNMRGMTITNSSLELYPNDTNGELGFATNIYPASNGFKVRSTSAGLNDGGDRYIYIAIRRGPMKTVTSATNVYATDTWGSTSPTVPGWKSGFPVDFALWKVVDSDTNFSTSNRFLQRYELRTSDTSAASGPTSSYRFDYHNGWNTGGSTLSTLRSWMFRRAPGFSDMVAWTGISAATQINHNLGVPPDLIIVKITDQGSYGWQVYCSALGSDRTLVLNSTSASSSDLLNWNNTTPTATTFTVGNSGYTNSIGNNYIAYLFASCPGVSKVSSYTGTGTTQQINCGFTAGARFVMIKRTDSTGDWYLWDTGRGITSDNDPYVRVNSTAAEVTNTDYIDPYSPGFEISSTAPAAINANGGTFIFLAIA